MAVTGPGKRYAAIMSMIGTGHAFSHLYLLVLPPLFPVLREEFGVSYAALGLLVTMMNVASAVCQVPAGILVDRFGARLILIGGLVLMGGSVLLMGFAPGYAAMLFLVVCSGAGNSVFHPADYSILSHSVDPKRLGRAFALHTFMGQVGFTIAPTVMIALTALWGWRAALVIVGCGSIVAAIAIWRGSHLLKDQSASGTENRGVAPAHTGTLSLLTPAVITMFGFFVLTAMVTSGLQSFLVTTLVQTRLWSLTSANGVLTAFLVATAAGVLLGGIVADRTGRHSLYAGIAQVASAVAVLLLALISLPLAALTAVFVLVGLLQGSIRPSRDMIVRSITPPGATGRVFGIVSVGLNVGAASTPVLIGYLIDIGYGGAFFYILSALMAVTVVTLGLVGRNRRETVAAE